MSGAGSQRLGVFRTLINLQHVATFPLQDSRIYVGRVSNETLEQVRTAPFALEFGGPGS
jgi:hypothetical protein